MSNQTLTVVTSVLLAILGWLIAYVTTIRRDRLTKRRDLRTQYLVDAYRRLEAAGNRLEWGTVEARALESAVADIQLLGCREQADLARAFAQEFVSQRKASLDSLLEALRAELRKELELEPLSQGIVHLRITP